MEKLANIFVKGRYVLLVIMFAFAAFCAYMMPKANINSDMTKYLPDSSRMSQGVKVMNEEFGNEAADQMTLKVMFDDLTDEEKTKISSEISGIGHVAAVEYDANSASYNKDNHTLYILTVDTEDDIKSVEETLANKYEGKKFVTAYNNMGGSLPPLMIITLLTVVLVIMLVMCGSYLEPFLFLLTIGVAIVLNMGTNAFLPSVSTTTNGISSILQLVLSMDYSIILSNRYRQASKKNDNHVESMTKAIKESIVSVSSSALTTIVGLLSLVFMSFKIGGDLGFVLAKGVFFSLLCVFTVLPAIMLMFDKAIAFTSKNPITIPMKKMASFSYKKRILVSVAFLVILVLAFIGKFFAGIEYDSPEENDITKVFAQEQKIVVLYKNSDEGKMNEFISEVSEFEGVVLAQGYANTLGMSYDASALGSMMSSAGIDASIVKVLYYDRLADRTDEKMSLSQLVAFVNNMMSENSYIADNIDEDTLGLIKSLVTKIGQIEDDKQYNVDEMYELISGFSKDITKEYVNLFYEFYFASVNYNENWAITIDELFDTILNSKNFEGIITAKQKAGLIVAKAMIDKNKAQLVGNNYSRAILTVNTISGSDEMMDIVKKIMETGDKYLDDEFYIGNAIMAYEMENSFGEELNRITLITAFAIFVVVAISFKSLVVPAVLVMVIQSSVYVTMSIMGIINYDMNYLALLIMQCILMGATVDYAIVFTNYYREKRQTSDIEEALARASQSSIRTILTSGLIMAVATAVLGFAYQDGTIGPIVRIISAGVVSAMILIIVFLPSLLAVLDRFVVKNKK